MVGNKNNLTDKGTRSNTSPDAMEASKTINLDLKDSNMKKLLILAGLYALLAGCASNNVTPLSQAELTKGPDAGKTLVTFMRPSSFGGAIQSNIYDGDNFIGTVSANTKICYQAAPGKHMFMVIGESADFMQADLTEGKTYYVTVAPRMGVWKARFSLNPASGAASAEEIAKWDAATKEVKTNDKGVAWAKAHQAEIMKMKNEYLPKWESKAEADKQTLRAESGK